MNEVRALVIVLQGLHIRSADMTPMQEWQPPGHWSAERRSAYQRSMAFLRTIVEQSGSMELHPNKHRLPTVLIQGHSRRWYRIDAEPSFEEVHFDGFGIVMDVSNWNLPVTGGAWKTDVLNETSHAVSICIHPRAESRDLPIGDRLAALALSLMNDKKTGMRIPLLAQFIVSPRKHLAEVWQFSQEGVVLEQDIYYGEDLMAQEEDELDDIATLDLAWEQLDSWLEDAGPIDELVEHNAFNHWCANLEDRANATNEAMEDAFHDDKTFRNDEPWHHNEDEVWRLEDDLRSKAKS